MHLATLKYNILWSILDVLLYIYKTRARNKCNNIIV